MNPALASPAAGFLLGLIVAVPGTVPFYASNGTVEGDFGTEAISTNHSTKKQPEWYS